MIKRILSYVVLIAFAACGTGGYTFTGGDVGDAKTISVGFFENYADLVQPELSQKTTQALQDIFVQQTSLQLVPSDGDLTLEGSITDYRIDPINAQANDLGAVSQNRLTVVVNVIYTNKLDPKKSFEQRFSRFADFDADADFASAESTLIDQVTQELAENILNQSIGNW